MDINSVLKQKGIKATPNRLGLVEILNKAHHPLNSREIETRLSKQQDRVTLYRNLKLLVEHGILHKIEVNGSVTSYTISPVLVNKDYNTQHLHFHCKLCEKVICMPQCEIKKYDLPEGFTQDDCQLVVNGICNVCNSSKKTN